MANVNIRVDDALKKEVVNIFTELGLSMSTATNVFYRQVVRHGGIPFDLGVSDPFYSAENQVRLQQSASDYETGKSKPVIKTMDELKEMENE